MEKQTNEYYLPQTNRSHKPFYPTKGDPVIINRSNLEWGSPDTDSPVVPRKKIHLDDRYNKYRSQILKTEPSRIS